MQRSVHQAGDGQERLGREMQGAQSVGDDSAHRGEGRIKHEKPDPRIIGRAQQCDGGAHREAHDGDPRAGPPPGDEIDGGAEIELLAMGQRHRPVVGQAARAEVEQEDAVAGSPEAGADAQHVGHAAAVPVGADDDDFGVGLVEPPAGEAHAVGGAKLQLLSLGANLERREAVGQRRSPDAVERRSRDGARGQGCGGRGGAGPECGLRERMHGPIVHDAPPRSVTCCPEPTECCPIRTCDRFCQWLSVVFYS